MNTPSIETIMTRLEEPLRKQALITHKRAAVLIRAYMMGADTPGRVDQAMDAINTILSGYGVESIKDNRWTSYYCDIGLLYVNMGDTYTMTILLDHEAGRYSVTSWGNWVEAYSKKRGII